MKASYLIFTTLLLTGCAVDSGFDIHPKETKSADTAVNLKPATGEAVILTTTADSVNTLYRGTIPTITGTNMAPTTIQIDPSTTYQTIDGFGFALTYSSAYNLMHMSQAQRTAFLKRTFSPTEGYDVSYLRISIGCSDFSSRVYTLCDTEGIENFALDLPTMDEDWRGPQDRLQQLDRWPSAPRTPLGLRTVFRQIHPSHAG